MSRADDDVVIRARDGDEEAWRELYLAHGRRLVVWLRSTPTLDASLSAEDIAAEAWTVAATKIGGFRGSTDDFGGWLISIARNIAVNSVRRARRRQTYATEDAGSDELARGPAPDERILEEDAVRRLLGHLSPREAEVIACIDVVGLDVAATSEALGLSPSAVRVARFRGLGRLRRVLGDAVDEGSPSGAGQSGAQHRPQV
jgi:RNA polymerase sigma-70 factor (ECF subfamily)